nr:immunoglobulin light chain junction region [Macaca mulatta]MOX28544.1 immunoglobulin light chain junction region [Macaca mulatta]MOX28833.1 immunoglobulin light chain junction region [Macaca mulatta]MOX30818.1 immunoglobulin light chain junction region [Macaca mulatta]MOX30832.1 immunoglobulin light chain junction region [Macaca mulatta]
DYYCAMWHSSAAKFF